MLFGFGTNIGSGSCNHEEPTVLLREFGVDEIGVHACSQKIWTLKVRPSINCL